jgi:LysM repeat protein
MAERTVTVRLKVEDQFSQPVNSYTQKMTQAEQATKKASDSARQSSSAFAGMGQALTGAIAAFGVMGTIHVAEQLYQTGMQAQRTGMLFASFGAQVGDTSSLLERLRQTTRGVVSDTALMAGASQQLSMGLAQNANDVNRLMNIGVTFAQAQGQDVQASLENLNMILANQSYLRLDTLGISSSQVRELAGQYRAAGMDSSEAFNAAFMDVAEQKLPQMAAVAEATVTEFQKLQTSMDNWWTDFGERFSQGVNGLINIATHGGDLIRAALWGDLNVQSGMAAAATPRLGELAMQLAPDWNQNRGRQAELIAAAARNMGRDATTFTPDELRQILGTLASANTLGSYNGDQDNQRAAELAARVLRIYNLTDGYTQASPRGAAGDYLYGANSPYRTDIGYSTPVVPNIPHWYDALTAGGMVNFGLPQQTAGQRYAGQQNYLDYLWDQMGRNSLHTGSVPRGGQFVTDSVYFSDEEIQRAEQNARLMQETVDAAERWNELTGQDMVSDTDLTKMQGMAEAGQAWADSMQRASEVDLSTLFGQTSGGQFDQVNQAVLDQLRAGGATPEQLQSAEQTMGMHSGTMTGMSVQFDNQIKSDLADIWTQLGPDAYFAAQQSIIESWRDIRTQNPDYTGPIPEDLALSDAGIMQQQGSAYTVQRGDTVWGLAHAAGMSVQDYMAANGLDSTMLSIGQSIGSANQYTWNPNMIGNAGDVQVATDARAQQMADSYRYNLEEGFQGAADTLQSALENVVVPTIQVPIELVVGNGGILAQLIASIVQGNGGTVPGSSGNPGRSSSPRNGNAGVNTSRAIGGGV